MDQARIAAVGEHLRLWRQRRRLSQLDLALEAEISARHLSFVETGRARPSRDMVLHLAERLEVPLRERNAMLVAAGYAPVFHERRLDDPELETVRAAVHLVLNSHEPFPAIAVDRHCNLIASNRASRLLTEGVDPVLLQPPINSLRLALHPGGMAPRIVNFRQWRSDLLGKLRRKFEASADPVLADLWEELSALPGPEPLAMRSTPGDQPGRGVLPLQLIVDDQVLSFFSTATRFGAPVDITLSELELEAFFPADAATVQALQARAASPPASALARLNGHAAPAAEGASAA